MLTTVGGTSNPWGNANSDHCWKNSPQIRTVITGCVRFDCIKYSGERAAGDDLDDNGDNRATYSLGIAMLVLRALPFAILAGNTKVHPINRVALFRTCKRAVGRTIASGYRLRYLAPIRMPLSQVYLAPQCLMRGRRYRAKTS